MDDSPLPGFVQALRAVWRLLGVAVHLGHGMVIVARRWPQLDRCGRERHIAWWAAKLLRLLGVQLAPVGQFSAGSWLLVANHVSWLDIVAIHALCPRVRFVAKADIRAWPFIGPLVGAAGTLFVERESKRDALRVVHLMAAALQAGDAVAVFPEGTTGTGRQLLPFHGNLLQAAISTATPVQAVALRYRERRPVDLSSAVWTGESTLVSSLWRIANAQGLQARVTVLPVRTVTQMDRRALAAEVRHAIALAIVHDDQ